jgi:hypothetical protein
MGRSWLLAMVFLVAAPCVDACSLPHGDKPQLATKLATKGQTTTGFQVGAGVSGSWFDAARNGEGIIVEILPDGRALAIWFTYPAAGESGEQAWLIAQDGVIEGDRIRFSQVFRPLGARFGPAFDPAQLQVQQWGTLEMQFSSCTASTVSWAGPASYGSGSRAMTRLSTLDEVDCGGARRLTSSGARAADGLRSRSGAWYVPARSGEGWIVEELGDGRSLVYWFTFDPQGNQAWTIGSGVRDGNRLRIDDNRITRGTRFGNGFVAADVQALPWGSLDIHFDRCGNGSLSYSSTLEGYGTGGHQPQRLTTIAGAPCLDSMPGSIAGASWAERARTLSQRQSEHAVTVHNGALYALGGFGGQRVMLRYNRANDAWTALPSLPAGRDHLAAFAFDNGIYMVGGSANGSGDQGTSAFRFDLTSQTWEPRAELAWMYGSHAAILHGRAYIGDVDGSLQQYDPRARIARRIAAPDFTQRDHSQVVAFLDEIWVIAGRSPETRTVAIFDPVSERWRAGPSIVSPRGGFAAATVGNRIVIGGGEVIFQGTYVEGSTEVYGAGAVGWEAGPALPVAVHGVAGAAVDGRFVLVSGSTDAGQATGNTGRVFELTLPP